MKEICMYWWICILFSPECKELTSMLDPLLYMWGVPPVVIRCVHWTICKWGTTDYWIQIIDVFAHMTLTFGGWLPETIGHFFYVTSSFMYHFKAIGKIKLEVQSGNAKFGSKLVIFLSHVTSKFDRWPWKTTGHLSYTTSSFVHHFIAKCEFKLELWSGNS